MLYRFVPLKNFSKERVRLSFRLEADRGVEDLCAISDVRVHEPIPDAPSVLLVTSDTHRADHIASAPGGTAVHTPALDALAREGVLFSDCFATSNITLPSHAALLTGLHPRDTGITNNRTRLGEQAEIGRAHV